MLIFYFKKYLYVNKEYIESISIQEFKNHLESLIKIRNIFIDNNISKLVDVNQNLECLILNKELQICNNYIFNFIKEFTKNNELIYISVLKEYIFSKAIIYKSLRENKDLFDYRDRNQDNLITRDEILNKNENFTKNEILNENSPTNEKIISFYDIDNHIKEMSKKTDSFIELFYNYNIYKDKFNTQAIEFNLSDIYNFKQLLIEFFISLDKERKIFFHTSSDMYWNYRGILNTFTDLKITEKLIETITNNIELLVSEYIGRNELIEILTYYKNTEYLLNLIQNSASILNENEQILFSKSILSQIAKVGLTINSTTKANSYSNSGDFFNDLINYNIGYSDDDDERTDLEKAISFKTGLEQFFYNMIDSAETKIRNIKDFEQLKKRENEVLNLDIEFIESIKSNIYLRQIQMEKITGINKKTLMKYKELNQFKSIDSTYNVRDVFIWLKTYLDSNDYENAKQRYLNHEY